MCFQCLQTAVGIICRLTKARPLLVSGDDWQEHQIALLWRSIGYIWNRRQSFQSRGYNLVLLWIIGDKLLVGGDIHMQAYYLSRPFYSRVILGCHLTGHGRNLDANRQGCQDKTVSWVLRPESLDVGSCTCRVKRYGSMNKIKVIENWQKTEKILHLEWWRLGVMDRGLMSFFATLQCSITPKLFEIKIIQPRLPCFGLLNRKIVGPVLPFLEWSVFYSLSFFCCISAFFCVTLSL